MHCSFFLLLSDLYCAPLEDNDFIKFQLRNSKMFPSSAILLYPYWSSLRILIGLPLILLPHLLSPWACIDFTFSFSCGTVALRAYLHNLTRLTSGCIVLVPQLVFLIPLNFLALPPRITRLFVTHLPSVTFEVLHVLTLRDEAPLETGGFGWR